MQATENQAQETFEGFFIDILLEACRMGDHQNSDSTVQRQAECIIFEKVCKWLGLSELQRNPTIFLTDASYPRIEPDFYSGKHLIVGEIFAHVGPPKRGQHNKISNDILKMLLLDKMTRITHRKIIVVCDTREENALRGESALAECIRQFGIEIKRIDLDAETREKILFAQEQQFMVNR